MSHKVKMKRVYEAASSTDGYRILVDRIWPRGINKKAAAVDEWNKDIAPTTEARKSFQHDPEKFDSFKEKYLQELDANPETPTFIQQLNDCLKTQDVTLVYAAKDEVYNHVVILKEYIEKKL